MDQRTDIQPGIITAWRQFADPIVILSHVVVKIITIVFYILGNLLLFSPTYLTLFLLCINLAAADFWIVKNISGRFLVRLRWWK